MSAIGLGDLLREPHSACGSLCELLPQLTSAVVTEFSKEQVTLDLRLVPPYELQAHDYPIERVLVTQGTGLGQLIPQAVPQGPTRTWKHRYPSIDGTGGGALCLWYPLDPPHLRWDWTQGLESFVVLVHRHLLTEELVRRGNPWPVEDAPHGHRSDGSAHPILTKRRT